MTETAELAIERGCRAREREKITVSQWAAEHMRTERGEHLDFDAYPHMRAVMDDRFEQKGMMCGSQTGKTTTALADVFHACDTWRIRAIVTMPTDDYVQVFSKTRAKPAIEASPYLSDRMGGVDSASVKTFRHEGGGQSVVLFKGARVDSQALSEPADLLYHDEIDRSRPDILSLFVNRLAASACGRRIITSTPTVPKFGIHARWEESSQTQWLVRCPECSDERALTWPDSVAIDAATPFYICANGHELTRETIRAGRWVDARTGPQEWRMYQMSRMLMDLWPAHRIVTAEASSDYQDWPEMFHNDVLGLPKASGDLAINADVLAKVMVGYPPWEASTGQVTFAGCDQSPRENEHRVMIGVVDSEGSHSYVWAGRCDWNRLADLMSLYRIQFLVIDAMPETSKARELRDQFPGRVYLAWYSNQPMQKTDKGEDVAIDRRERKVNLDRTAALDRSARRVIIEQDFFPAMPAEERRRFVNEMSNMSRAVEKDSHGQPQARWVEVGPDHYRHAHNYATVAGGMLARWSGGPTATSLDLTPGGGGERTVEDPATGRKLRVRPGYIPMPEGVIGPGKQIHWRGTSSVSGPGHTADSEGPTRHR